MMTLTKTLNYSLFLVAMVAFPWRCAAFTTPSMMPFSATTGNSRLFSTETDVDEATKLREKAAQLRAEIAAMEGKTLQEVEDEAKQKKENIRLRREQQEEQRKQNRKEAAASRDDGRFLQVPSTMDDMVRQASQSVERAFQDGQTRQTVRFALIRPDQYVNEVNEWPGGAQEMSRESAKPLTQALLKQVHAPTKATEEASRQQRLPPTVKEQDIWDFDGSALITAEAQAGANGDVQALVLPNTDTKYIKDIDSIDQAMGKRLFLLVNPFWRNLDSWGINILAPGAKKMAKEIIFDKGYNESYSLLRFSCRGEECVAVKAYPYDWQLFAYLEDDDNYVGGAAVERTIRLGSCKEEPSSALVTELLNERPEFQQTRTMRQFGRK
ncbi:Domain of unknown function (DUF1995) [Seminavis robusta]|uniref:DUF1995 domain-containing protein n=1 Tax=Seminavis robusta TaxID=568900 RepID=A0A9N8H4H0_9STRA|nr:Domain of unknown function (DUF1995) [Seminavis robusta]|eukprot:Sro49_g028740.1 Domain of unknown function (DUF1995) (382) ;mRNA; f:106376-107521